MSLLALHLLQMQSKGSLTLTNSPCGLVIARPILKTYLDESVMSIKMMRVLHLRRLAFLWT